MERLDLDNRLPDMRTATGPEAWLTLRLDALEGLVASLERRLSSTRPVAPSPLEDLSLRHLAKATGTARSAVRLMRDGCWTDAGILIRAIYEQLFAYLWVVQDPAKVESRRAMVTIKQEWANAKYLEGLAASAEPEARERLLEEARSYKAVAEALLSRLAAELGTTEKKVRDEAKLRVSAKAIEVNLGPRFTIPYAHYSGFVHSDGNALAAYGEPTDAGTAYTIRGSRPVGVPFASDVHHVLLRMAEEVHTRCPGLKWPELEECLRSHGVWLAEADRLDPRAGS